MLFRSDVLRGIDDALRQIARIAHDPLGGSPAREKQAQADGECYSYRRIYEIIIRIIRL